MATKKNKNPTPTQPAQRRAAVYLRVSTEHQDCDSQLFAITEWLKGKNFTITIYKDEGISGKTTKRPEFQRMLRDIDAGQFDSIICFRLDRISRTAMDAMKLLLDWMHRGMEFFAVDQPLLQLGSNNPLRLTIASLLAEFSQMEREAIVARVKAGMQVAKAKGAKLGNQKVVPEETQETIRSLRGQGKSIRQIAGEVGVSVGFVHKLVGEQSA